MARTWWWASACLHDRESTDALQLGQLPLLKLGEAGLLRLHLVLALLEAALAPLQGLELAIEALRPVEQEALLALQVGTLFACLLLGGALRLERIVLALKDDLFLL